MDFICHGVPSPKLWAANVDLIEKMAHGTLSSVSFRSKQVGRQNIGKAHGSTRQTLFEPSDRSPYMRLFLRDVCLRPSCYVCPAKTTRMADVTLGDFWGVEQVAPEMCDELGVSLIMIHSQKGATAWEGCREHVKSLVVKYEDAVRQNPAEHSSVVRPPERERFYKDLCVMGYEGVTKLYAGASRRERVVRAKTFVKDMSVRLGVWALVQTFRGRVSSIVGGTPKVLRYGVLYTFRDLLQNEKRGDGYGMT